MTADLHADHRPYLAALADGELELVPEATRAHVAQCDQGQFEVEAHELLGNRLRAATRSAAPAAPARSGLGSRLLLPLAAAAAVAIVAGGVFVGTRPHTPAEVASAVLVADRQPQFHSSDPAMIARWCTAQYGNRVPVVALTGLEPEGARMDWPEGQGIATVTYALGHQTIHVSWLSSAEGGSQPQVYNIDSRPAVLVSAHGLTALVSGTASQAELVHVADEVASIL